MYIFYYFLYSVYYVFYNLMYHVGLTVLAIVVCQIVWNRLPTDLKLLRSTASFKSELESFLVSCCLHWEHCVNSGMRHRSECRGRTTSHCCYCYMCCLLKNYYDDTVRRWVKLRRFWFCDGSNYAVLRRKASFVTINTMLHYHSAGANRSRSACSIWSADNSSAP